MVIDKCGNSTDNLYSYIQIGQSSGVLSSSTVPSTISAPTDGEKTTTSKASHSVATITVNRGTTLVITSFVPSEPSITASSVVASIRESASPYTSSTSADPPSGSVQSSQVTSSTGERSSSFWSSAGKVIGVFVAVGSVLLLAVLGILWKCRKRNGSKDIEKPDLPQPMAKQGSGSQTVSRSTSLLQLIGRREKGRADEDMGAASNRLSRSATDMVVPVVDQRLDPQSMMIRFDDNDSRTSFRDEEDYSRRVWRVTNASDSDSLRSNDVGDGYEKP